MHKELNEFEISCLSRLGILMANEGRETTIEAIVRCLDGRALEIAEDMLAAASLPISKSFVEGGKGWFSVGKLRGDDD